MKKLLSIAYTNTTFNLATFLLRVSLGILMCINHGLPKLTNYSELQHTFFDPFHIGHRYSLMLCLFAEVFTSLFLILGLFSRIAAFILLIDMCVAVFLFHRGQELKYIEGAINFLIGFTCILLIGPGKISFDAITGK